MRPSILATVSLIALTVGTAALLSARAPRRGRSPTRRGRADLAHARQKTLAPPVPEADRAAGRPGTSSATADVDELTRRFLLYFVLPISATAGVADWLCHRATDIETTAGARESVLHLVMEVEVGVALLAGLFLEITSPVLALMIASFVLHEVTALLDVSYAVTRRYVSPVEQMIHSFIETAPLMALAFTAVLRWPQFLALFGLGNEAPDFSVRLRRDPPTMRRRALAAAAVSGLEALLYAEELWRDVKASSGRLALPETGLAEA
jgi:hypothetical protein